MGLLHRHPSDERLVAQPLQCFAVPTAQLGYCTIRDGGIPFLMVDYPSEALAVNLSSKTLRGIIPLLALRPGEGHTLTELARFAGVDTKSVWQTLHQLQADGALLTSEYGRKTYSINPRYEFYAEIRTI